MRSAGKKSTSDRNTECYYSLFTLINKYSAVNGLGLFGLGKRGAAVKFTDIKPEIQTYSVILR